MLADDCENDYYRFGDIYLVGPGVVVISHPEDCKKVLFNHRFVKNKFYRAFALIEDNIYATQSTQLAMLRRRQLRHAFTPGYLKQMESTMLQCGLLLLKKRWDSRLGKQKQIQVQMENEFMHLAVGVIGALGYGQGPTNWNSHTRSQLIQWIHDYNLLSLVRLLVPLADKFPISLLFTHLIQSKCQFALSVDSAAESRLNECQQSKANRKADILQALLEGEDLESGSRMTRQQVVAENIAIIIASTDIVAQTLTWVFHYLLLCPHIYRKAAEEVRNAFSHTHLITFDEAKAQLPYVEACIYEAARIRAATGVFLPRVVPNEGVWIQGHFLPAGTQIGINIAGANHHRETWHDPQIFRPERFINNPQSKAHVLSFSAGVRMCPGKNLALYELLTTTANLLKDYEFSLPNSARFGRGKVDQSGRPVAMPRAHRFTSVGPKYPHRDCQVIVQKAQ
ncbi:hypothetical protein IWW36_001536 [Coemansia brasiliensis]|uniref:Cytochrome P450 n=1 Tax=Coemansia brasiliensis TaxID=2650707 RepID=A0A9W8I9H9_9FUNG|nr:hypothetical protein IWW36_001536 [Coemansia brasiliensis]